MKYLIIALMLTSPTSPMAQSSEFVALDCHLDGRIAASIMRIQHTGYPKDKLLEKLKDQPSTTWMIHAAYRTPEHDPEYFARLVEDVCLESYQ